MPKEPLESAPLNIHTLGDDALRADARRIGKVDERVRDLVRDMLRSMYTARGIGLAAPQVGVHQQLLVIDLDLETPSTPPLVLINPEITTCSASVDTYEEGCLSIPGVYLDVVRPTAIQLSFRDEMGRPRTMKGWSDGALYSARDGPSPWGAVCRSCDRFQWPQQGAKGPWLPRQGRPPHDALNRCR